MNVDLDAVVGNVNIGIIELMSKIDKATYNFTLKGTKNSWNIEVIFKRNFPFSLPVIVLKDQQYIGILPHVNQGGIICLEEDDSIIFDHTRPSDIIGFALESAVRLLDRMRLRIYRDELLDELEGYFFGKKEVNSFYYAKDKVEWIYLKVSHGRQKFRTEHVQPIFLQGKNKPIPRLFSNVANLNNFQQIKILHLPLDSSDLPPANGQNINQEYVYSQLKKVSKNRRALYKFLEKIHEGMVFFILLSMPRSSGERTQFLLKYSSKKKYLTHSNSLIPIGI